MSAQFFSSLADNALLVGAIELLKSTQAPAWQVPALTPMFALFYVLLAPLVGAFADAVPKGQVMFVSNTIKVAGCLLMLFGGHPLMAVCGGRARRGGVLAGQVRHPHRTAAAVAAGQGQRLDRGPDDRLDHPRRAARRPARRAAGGADAAGLRPAELRHRRRHAARGGDRVDRAAVHRGGDLQPLHPAHRRAVAAAADQRGRAWSPTSASATRGCGPTSWARSRWPPPRCSGACRATCG